MNSSESHDPAASPSIPITFEVTSDEGFKMGREMEWKRSDAWPRKIGSVLAAFMSVKFAFSGDWLTAALCAAMAFSLWSQILLMYWMLRLLCGSWKSQFNLKVDGRGIHGEQEYGKERGGRTERKEIEHEWNRLTKLEPFPSCFLFEFHGGAAVFIPVRAFASQADLEQCETWAQNGLVQGRLKSTHVGHAPA